MMAWPFVAPLPSLQTFLPAFQPLEAALEAASGSRWGAARKALADIKRFTAPDEHAKEGLMYAVLTQLAPQLPAVEALVRAVLPWRGTVPAQWRHLCCWRCHSAAGAACWPSAACVLPAAHTSVRCEWSQMHRLQTVQRSPPSPAHDLLQVRAGNAGAAAKALNPLV